jgi:very-short-patch-repair endonuclease
MSLPETLLWDALRGSRLNGLRFRRQHPIGPYILDFFNASARLAIEIDGASHEDSERIRHDARRDAWLASQGVHVLRIPASDVLNNERFDGVLAKIVEAAAPSTASGGPPPP